MDILLQMWIDSEIDPRHIKLPDYWAAGAICLKLHSGAANAIDQAAKGDRHCKEDIARTGLGLDEHQEGAENWY